MKNPCEECIVDAMCREGCDKFILFLRRLYLSKGQITDSYAITILIELADDIIKKE